MPTPPAGLCARADASGRRNGRRGGVRAEFLAPRLFAARPLPRAWQVLVASSRSVWLQAAEARVSHTASQAGRAAHSAGAQPDGSHRVVLCSIWAHRSLLGTNLRWALLGAMLRVRRRVRGAPDSGPRPGRLPRRRACCIGQSPRTAFATWMCWALRARDARLLPSLSRSRATVRAPPARRPQRCLCIHARHARARCSHLRPAPLNAAKWVRSVGEAARADAAQTCARAQRLPRPVPVAARVHVTFPPGALAARPRRGAGAAQGHAQCARDKAARRAGVFPGAARRHPSPKVERRACGRARRGREGLRLAARACISEPGWA